MYDLRMSKDEHLSIPDWTASLTAFGFLCAVIGFVLAWFSTGGFATLLLTVGLVIAAIGLGAAEKTLRNATRE